MNKARLFVIALLAISLITQTIPKISGAGYGEENESLGQFVDDYENDDNVSVAVNVINNQTLDCMELNYTGEVLPYENFTLWAETDPQAKISPIDYNVSWINYERNDGGRVVKDFGINAIVNFDFRFEFKISDLSSATATGRTILIVLTVDQEDSIGLGQHYSFIQLVEDGASDTTYVWWLTSKDAPAASNSQVGTVKMDVGTTYYIHFYQTGGNKTLLVYSDSGFTNLLQKLTHIIGNDAYRYVQVAKIVASDTDPNDYTSGYINEFYNGTYQSGYEPEGYFITENYLNYTIGQSLTLLTNASLPESTSITAEFSQDNSTWVDNEGNIGGSNVLNGFYALDLRDLNYTDCFVRYNFIGLRDSTPRIYQSRLITTEGIAGECPPGYDYSIIFLAIGLILMLSIAFLYVRDK